MTFAPLSASQPSALAARTSGAVVSLQLTTGGSGYTSAPTVTFSGGGGTGAAAVAHMAGTMVESVVLTNAGTGYTSNPTVTIAGNAQATAYAYAGAFRPATFLRSRFNDMYAVDGMGRGLRWNGEAGYFQPIGISKPAVGPAVTPSASGAGQYVSSIDVLRGGAGYTTVPTVTVTGGGATKQATATASISAGRVTQIDVTDSGAGYTSAPTVTLTGGCAGGASLSVGVSGFVGDLVVTSGGSGYTGTPTLAFSSAQGLTKANGYVSVSNGSVVDAVVLSGGTGATTTGVTVSVVGGGGNGASITPRMVYRVTAVTVVSGGTGFQAAPVITFLPNKSDTRFVSAAATATASSGAVASVAVLSGGEYELPPTAIVQDNNAVATASMTPAMYGTYKCAIRYLDDTPKDQQGPIPSSISELVEVDAGATAGTLTWAFTHSGLEDRVKAMELWRTTSGQSVVLFRVATIKRADSAFFGSYLDTLTDEQLRDTERDGYGLMPVTLPSGQVNARRFEVPPGNYGVAVMFQDRAWYGVDTTGRKPNSLLFSEVDEPESVPPSNELVIQESIGDSDALVALIPLATMLLAVQRRHIYKIMYVAQPVIDASIMLASYRGILNDRCWDVMAGVAFIADSYGIYAFDGTNEEPISAPIDDMWRNRVIDFTKSSQFHVKCDTSTKTVRFYFCRSTDTAPVRALCFCMATKAWWEEEYPYAVTASANMELGSRQDVVCGTSSGGFVRASGYADGSTPVSYRMRTGCMTLANVDKGSRSISVLYAPTSGNADLKVGLHFNGSSSPRPNAITSDRGDGFTTTAGSTAAVLNMKKGRSKLGDASGFARAYYAGQVDDRSAGSDRHIAISVSGQQSAQENAVVLHAMTIEGANG
jgi:hypothetical protein